MMQQPRLPAIVATLWRPPGSYEFLYVETPYLPDFPPRARKLGGVWSDYHLVKGERRRCWRFDPRDADRVAALCDELYGYSWMNQSTVRVQTINLTLPMERFHSPRERYGFGRLLIRVRESKYDSRIELGWSVLILDGSFYAKKGTLTLQVRDIPLGLFEREADDWLAKGCTIERIEPTVPRSLPMPEDVNRLPFDMDANVRTILDAWDRLDAVTQDHLLEILRNRLPGGIL